MAMYSHRFLIASIFAARSLSVVADDDLFATPARVVLGERTFNITSLEAADFDGDGDDDLLIGTQMRQFGAYSEVFVLFSEQSGNEVFWSDPMFLHSTINTGDGYWGASNTRAFVANMNGDDYPDIIYTECIEINDDLIDVVARLRVVLNNGDGTFDTEHAITLPDYLECGSSLATGDLNNDSHDDIVGSILGDYRGNGSVRVFLTVPDDIDGSLSFETLELDVPAWNDTNSTLIGKPNVVSMMDVNNDNRLDILIGGEAPVGESYDDPLAIGGVAWYRNTASEGSALSFAPQEILFSDIAFEPARVEIGDFNGDQKTDILIMDGFPRVGRDDVNELLWLENTYDDQTVPDTDTDTDGGNNATSFTRHRLLAPSNGIITSVVNVAADVANGSSSSQFVYGQTSLTVGDTELRMTDFQGSGIRGLSSAPTEERFVHMCVADVDGDSRPDLVVARGIRTCCIAYSSVGNDSIEWFRNGEWGNIRGNSSNGSTGCVPVTALWWSICLMTLASFSRVRVNLV